MVLAIRRVGAPDRKLELVGGNRSEGGLGFLEVGGTSVGAPSWAGLIAIADQGLALAGKGSLSNAQADLYELPSSDFHDITSGSTPFNSAGPGYDLVTGLGSPKANLLIPALVAATGGSSAATTTTTARPAVSILAPPHDVSSINTAPSPAGGSGSTSTTGSSSGSTTSITPSTGVVPSGSIAPAPIVAAVASPGPIVNLGPSTALLTTRAILAVAANEQSPTTPTIFGQGATDESGVRGSQRQVGVPSPEALPIDVVEPFQPAAPEAEGQPALPPSAARPRSLPAASAPEFETLVDVSIADLLPQAPTGSARRGDQPEDIPPSWGLSAVIGAAIVAAGGYHLALQRSDRFRGRWVPGRTGADRSGHRQASVRHTEVD